MTPAVQVNHKRIHLGIHPLDGSIGQLDREGDSAARFGFLGLPLCSLKGRYPGRVGGDVGQDLPDILRSGGDFDCCVDLHSCRPEGSAARRSKEVWVVWGPAMQVQVSLLEETT